MKSSPPAINQFATHEICDNPTRYFNLNEINTIIINNDANALITYYENATNAELGTDAISTDYTYKSFSYTIYIKIESAVRECHYVYPFQLIDNPLPINKLSDIETCDTDYDNICRLDFSQQNSLILGSQNPNNFNLSYYLTEEDAITKSTPYHSNRCLSVSKEVMIIDVPKFVTPNGDGQFDTWHITGVNQLVGTIIYIYNRQGKLLKTLPHTATGWDGTYHGVNMPTDDYWYLAHVFYKGKEFELKGHFTLKR